MALLFNSSSADLARAANLLSDGKLVAFPTETVYGLGADARNPVAVREVFRAKGRPDDHPLIVHIAAPEDMTLWARNIPDCAWTLARHFWPGPLTLILQRAAGVLDEVTGAQDTVGIRIPGNPVALALLTTFGSGIAAPSANRFGRISPTCAEDVLEELGDAVAGIIDGGPCQVGIESTILDLSGAIPCILRPGKISGRMLAKLLQVKLAAKPQADAPRVSGMLEAHYAPQTALKLVRSSAIDAQITNLHAQARSVSLLSRLRPLVQVEHWQSMPADPDDYGRQLYRCLREADALSYDHILVEEPPKGSAWNAVRDRLQRGTVGSGKFVNLPKPKGTRS